MKKHTSKINAEKIRFFKNNVTVLPFSGVKEEIMKQYYILMIMLVILAFGPGFALAGSNSDQGVADNSAITVNNGETSDADKKDTDKDTEDGDMVVEEDATEVETRTNGMTYAAGGYGPQTGGSYTNKIDCSGGIAIGDNAYAGHICTIAIGDRSKATGFGSAAIGAEASASGSFATATGALASASGEGASASGAGANASGDFSTASGFLASATGTGATATGTGATASGFFASAFGSGATASGMGATATGALATASGAGATATGVMATASGDSASAYGAGATASGTGSLALGADSSATADNSVALGQGSVADQANTVSVGASGSERRVTNVADGVAATDAANYGQLCSVQYQVDNNAGNIAANSANITANAFNIAGNASDIAETQASMAWLSSGYRGAAVTSDYTAIAIGPNASARTDDIAIGFNADVTADGSTALGTSAVIDSENSVAIGADSRVTANATGGTALGQNAAVVSGADGSVALGKDAVATEADTVSVGNTENQRRVTNMAAGVNNTDAVNKQQLDTVNDQLNSSINHNAGNIDRNYQALGMLNEKIDDLEHESRAGIAAAAALISLMPSQPGKTTVNVGTASYKSEVAAGVTAVHRFKNVDRLIVNAGMSFANDAVLVRAGGSWEF